MKAARNKDRSLYLYNDFGSLSRTDDRWVYYSLSSIRFPSHDIMKLDDNLLPELTWEMDPVDVEVVLASEISRNPKFSVGDVINWYDEDGGVSKEFLVSKVVKDDKGEYLYINEFGFGLPESEVY